MEFLSKNPIFNIDEFKDYLAKKGTKGSRSAESLLAYYLKAGHIIRIKRGLYAVVPAGSNTKKFVPDPCLIAGKITFDAVLINHTALEWHGKAYSVFSHFTYQTERSLNVTSYRGWKFQPVKVPISLQKKKQSDFGVLLANRQGVDVRVTSLERTLVDILDRPKYSGSWEEIWRSLEFIEFFDLDKVVEYLALLDKAPTAAKVGFFLEQNREPLMVEDKYLKKIKEYIPNQPRYFDQWHKNGKLNKKWNLIIPEKILNKTWEEVL